MYIQFYRCMGSPQTHCQASLVGTAWRAVHFTAQPAASTSRGWGSNMSQTRMRAKPANSCTSVLPGSLLPLDSDFNWMKTSVLQGCHQVPHSAHQHLGSHGKHVHQWTGCRPKGAKRLGTHLSTISTSTATLRHNPLTTHPTKVGFGMC